MSEYSLEEEKNKINYLFDEILNLSNKIRFINIFLLYFIYVNILFIAFIL